MIDFSSEVVVVVGLSIQSTVLVGLVRWHHVFGRSLLSVEVLDGLMLLLSVMGQFLSDRVLFILNLSVDLFVDVFVDEILDLGIGDLSGLWSFLYLRNWWHWRLVVSNLRPHWELCWRLVNRHTWLLVRDNWHSNFLNFQFLRSQLLWFSDNIVEILFVS